MPAPGAASSDAKTTGAPEVTCCNSTVKPRFSNIAFRWSALRRMSASLRATLGMASSVMNSSTISRWCLAVHVATGDCDWNRLRQGKRNGDQAYRAESSHTVWLSGDR